MKIEINQLTCQRCAHKWFPRSTEVVICPHCKSPYWDKKKHRISKTKATISPRIEKVETEEVQYVPDEGNV
jgi:Zn finger protein HypA/HybF involved in hydrogenase expression